MKIGNRGNRLVSVAITAGHASAILPDIQSVYSLLLYFFTSMDDGYNEQTLNSYDVNDNSQ